MFLKGKRVLITGAGSGIGRALAVEAAARGMELALVGRRRGALEETAALAAPGNCLILSGDVTEPEARRRIYLRLAQEWGELDVLVNNAGLVSAGPLAGLSDIELERLIRTNLVAPIGLTRDMLPLLVTAAPSKIVNVGSMFGDIAYPLFGAYSASKFGLRGFSVSLRHELLGFGIGVTYAAPGATETAAASAFGTLIEPMGMRLDAPQAVARQIWDGVMREAKVIYPGRLEQFFVLLQRLCPALVEWALAAQLKDKRLSDPLAAATLAVRPPLAVNPHPPDNAAAV